MILGCAVAVVRWLSRVWPFVTPWTAKYQALLSFTNSPELAQTHVHWVDDAIQPSPPLSSPSLPALNLCQHQGAFPKDHLLASEYWSFSISSDMIVQWKFCAGTKISHFLAWLPLVCVFLNLHISIKHHKSSQWWRYPPSSKSTPPPFKSISIFLVCLSLYTCTLYKCTCTLYRWLYIVCTFFI